MEATNYISPPSYEYVTYSFGEGIEVALIALGVILAMAFANMIIAAIIGYKKKDLLVVFVGNVFVKTFLGSIYITGVGIMDKMIPSPDDYIAVLTSFFLAGMVGLEGFIFNRLLKDKKMRGTILSFICNFVGTFAVFVLLKIFT